MKALIVYYSLEGNTDLIAKRIAAETNADLLRLIPKKEYPSGGFKKYFWGGKSVVFGDKPDLEKYQVDLNKYDKIIIGTPIWAGSYTPPIKTFLSDNKLENKEIYLYACHLGGGALKCFTKLKDELKGNKFIATADFLDPKSKGSNNVEEQIKEFCRKIK